MLAKLDESCELTEDTIDSPLTPSPLDTSALTKRRAKLASVPLEEVFQSCTFATVDLVHVAARAAAPPAVSSSPPDAQDNMP